jgi:hypothetical protein
MPIRFWPLLFLGVISSTEEIYPAQVVAPAGSVAACDERPQSAARLIWSTRPGDPAGAAVELVGAQPAALRTLERFDVTPEQWRSFLAVRVMPAGKPLTGDLPPLWGSYRLAADTIRFEPRFRLEPGTRYRARFDAGQLAALVRTLTRSGDEAATDPRDSAPICAEFELAAPSEQPAAKVAAIYPTSDTLPENLLRLYVVFTAAMSRGEAYRRIKLIDSGTGQVVDSPFLEIDEELWSPDGKRFTLLFDPGRIKRGLKPREELGPVLEAGRSYVLIIDGDWADAVGRPLKSGFRKVFRVGLPDGLSPDPKTWSVVSPRPHSREPVVVRFPGPLDRALLERLIWIEDRDARVVPGSVVVGDAERRWQFAPGEPWHEGDYRLVIGADLEDVAGNSVARPFEVDVAGPISGRVATTTVNLPFRVDRGPR